MLRSEFLKLVHNPRESYAHSYEELEGLLYKFPYCQPLRQILLKKYYHDNNHRMEDYLHIASASSPDREFLYHFVNHFQASKTIALHHVSQENDAQEEVENSTDTTLELPIQEEVNVVSVAEVPEHSDILEVAPIEDEEVAIETEPAHDNITMVEEPQIIEIEPLPIELPQTEEEPSVENLVEPEMTVQADIPEIPVITQEADEIEDFVAQQPEPIVQARQESDLHTAEPSIDDFKEWLHAFRPPRLKVEPSNTKEGLKIRPVAKQEIQERISKIMVREEKQDVIPFEKVNKQSVKLLEVNEVHRSADEFAHVQVLADKSISEEDTLVSETLINILIKQGKFDKAIKMFEKLSLKYPEKNRYFATRIKELQEKQ